METHLLSETMISIRIDDIRLLFIITVSYLIKPKCLKVVHTNRRHLTELFRSLQMCAKFMSATLCRNHGNVGCDVTALQMCVA